MLVWMVLVAGAFGPWTEWSLDRESVVRQALGGSVRALGCAVGSSECELLHLTMRLMLRIEVWRQVTQVRGARVLPMDH